MKPAILLCFAVSAHAGEIGRIPNEVDGAIVLASEKCVRQPGHAAYSFSGADGRFIVGCWTLKAGRISVRWATMTSEYEIQDVQFTPEFMEFMKRSKGIAI